MLKLLLILAIYSNIKADEIIDFSSDTLVDGNGFLVTDNSVTIVNSGTYILRQTSLSRSLIISQSISVTLKPIDFEFHFTKDYDLTPMIIGKNAIVNFEGVFAIEDYSEKKNEKNALIYMETGAKINCNSDEELQFVLVSPIKYAIYGENSNLINLNKCGIYYDALGIINVANLIVNDSDINHVKEIDSPSIQVSDSITLKNGEFIFKGQGIKAGKNIYIEQNGIETFFQSLGKIESGENIEINSGFYYIQSLEEIFKAGKDITIQKVNFELYSGSKDFPVQPIVAGGNLKISNSNIFIASYDCVKELPNQKETFTYSGKISKDQTISITSDQGTIGVKTMPREFNYIYYTGQQTGLKMKIDNRDVEKTDPNSCQTKNADSSSSKQNGDGNGKDKNVSEVVKMCYILLLISLILLN